MSRSLDRSLQMVQEQASTYGAISTRTGAPSEETKFDEARSPYLQVTLSSSTNDLQGEMWGRSAKRGGAGSEGGGRPSGNFHPVAGGHD